MTVLTRSVRTAGYVARWSRALAACEGVCSGRAVSARQKVTLALERAQAADGAVLLPVHNCESVQPGARVGGSRVRLRSALQRCVATALTGAAA